MFADGAYDGLADDLPEFMSVAYFVLALGSGVHDDGLPPYLTGDVDVALMNELRSIGEIDGALAVAVGTDSVRHADYGHLDQLLEPIASAHLLEAFVLLAPHLRGPAPYLL